MTGLVHGDAMVQDPDRDLSAVPASVREIVREAERLGASVKTVAQWSKALVVHLAAPMTDDMRNKLKTPGAAVRYFLTDGDPHNPAHEGFIDDDAGAAISFPRRLPSGSVR